MLRTNLSCETPRRAPVRPHVLRPLDVKHPEDAMTLRNACSENGPSSPVCATLQPPEELNVRGENALLVRGAALAHDQEDSTCTQASDVDFSTKIGGTTFFSSSLKRRQGLPGSPAAAAELEVPTAAQPAETQRVESSTDPGVTTSEVDIPQYDVPLPCLAAFPHHEPPPALEGYPLPARAPRPRPAVMLSARELCTGTQLQPSGLLSQEDAALSSGLSLESFAGDLKASALMWICCAAP
ncbi:hypothetical protein CYMTET_27952 [Cymbomonas tetramitiformis]|uniref:Uncharacterized protein n=1 Tax=Cymbomonas tetramitiformis TaxID=36881 RepID=A0AAE0FP32_9CHLO|nr:hypothetical protein CYMTET_27952 [Cymbomonas tetramitiformis]